MSVDIKKDSIEGSETLKILHFEITPEGISGFTVGQCVVTPTTANTYSIQNCTTVNCTTINCTTVQCNEKQCSTYKCGYNNQCYDSDCNDNE